MQYSIFHATVDPSGIVSMVNSTVKLIEEPAPEPIPLIMTLEKGTLSWTSRFTVKKYVDELVASFEKALA